MALQFNANGKITTPSHRVIAVGEVRNVRVSFADILDGGSIDELQVLSEETTSEFTITGGAISAVARTIMGTVVPAGQAVEFSVDATAAAGGVRPRVDIAVRTDATPHQTILRTVTFEVEA